MSVKQLMQTEKKIQVLTLLQQNTLVQAAKFFLASVGISCSTSNAAASRDDIQWLHNFFAQKPSDRFKPTITC